MADADTFLNQLEPESLIRSFIEYPPVDFRTGDACHGTPVFQARFDLLTTAEAAFANRIRRLPGYRRWRSWLNPDTCFVGTTVTEYAMLPRGISPAQLVADLKTSYAKSYPFLIVKDIPCDSPLLDEATNASADALASACSDAGFVCVEGQALAFVPIDFDTIDAYLARLSRSRRKNIRRKLRASTQLDIETIATGAACFDDAGYLSSLYALYLDVYRQSDLQFDLLTADFFRAILQSKEANGVVFLYRHDGRLVGYNICYVNQGCLIDKYIGLAYPDSKTYNLYVLSWVHNLQYAVKHQLRYYIAGWTDPQIKADLGASFTFTRHAVYIRNPILRAVFRRISRHFESDRSWRDAAHVEAATHS